MVSCGESNNKPRKEIVAATTTPLPRDQLSDERATASLKRWRERQIDAFPEASVFPALDTSELEAPLTLDIEGSDFAEMVMGNATASREFDAVGMLLISESDSDPRIPWCTGTLIPGAFFGLPKFLTAAHCVSGHQRGYRYWVYLQHVGVISVSHIEPYCQKDAVCSSRNDAYVNAYDVAVLKFEKASISAQQIAMLRLIEPIPIAYDDDLTWGVDAHVVGFGITGEDPNYQDLAIKRAGNIATDECGGSHAHRADYSICMQACEPDGETPCAITLNRDSGGPMIIEDGERRLLLGVASRSRVWLDVSQAEYRDWITGPWPSWSGMLISLYDRVDLPWSGITAVDKCIFHEEGTAPEQICELRCDAETSSDAEACARSHQVPVPEDVTYVVAALNFPVSKKVGANLDKHLDYELVLSSGDRMSDCTDSYVNSDDENAGDGSGYQAVRVCRNSGVGDSTWQVTVASQERIDDFYQLVVTGVRPRRLLEIL